MKTKVILSLLAGLAVSGLACGKNLDIYMCPKNVTGSYTMTSPAFHYLGHSWFVSVNPNQQITANNIGTNNDFIPQPYIGYPSVSCEGYNPATHSMLNVYSILPQKCWGNNAAVIPFDGTKGWRVSGCGRSDGLSR